MAGLPQNGNRAPIAGRGRGRHNLHKVCHTTVTAPPHVGCVWCSGGLIVHLLHGGSGRVFGSEFHLVISYFAISQLELALY